MAKKIVEVRIAEWTAWIPQDHDKNSTLKMSNGVTGFEMLDSEKVLDVHCTGTPTARHFPTEVDGEMKNILHGLYAFQAVLAREVEAMPDDVVDPKHKTSAVVLPGAQNRAERRKSK